jgi:hypothetical protein
MTSQVVQSVQRPPASRNSPTRINSPLRPQTLYLGAGALHRQQQQQQHKYYHSGHLVQTCTYSVTVLTVGTDAITVHWLPMHNAPTMVPTDDSAVH